MTTTTTPHNTTHVAALRAMIHFIAYRNGLGLRLFKVDPETGMVGPEFDKLRYAAAELGGFTDGAVWMALVAWVKADKPLTVSELDQAVAA